MTSPTPEVEVGKPSIEPDPDATAAAGNSILEALDKLNDRVDILQDKALEEQRRAADLEKTLVRIQDAIGRETPEEVLEEIHRLTGLNDEGRQWIKERESILKTVEDLIHKVDSLAGQL